MSRFCRHLLLFISLIFVVGIAYASVQTPNEDLISLSGTWCFALDHQDAGITDKWFVQNLKDTIKLPGVLQSQGYGDLISKDTPWVLSLYDHNWFLRKDFKAYTESGNVKVPFLCQPPRHYLGRAWYQRDIEIPENWKGRRIGLLLERARWESMVWIDDQKIGSCDSLVAPHEYELGVLSPGHHRLTICVDNRMLMDYRPDAHSVSDSLASTWNGIVGKMELFNTTPIWIDEVQAFGDIHKKTVSLEVKIGNVTGKSGQGKLEVGKLSVPVSWDAKGGQAKLEVQLGNDAELWSEFNPKLHTLTVILNGDQANDSKEVTFGLRQISTDGNVLLVNGQPSHFRGTHSGGDFPLTGYPAMDVDYWRDLFKTCKEWGLNHMRFHSLCPPEAAFVAADEIGMYLQPEAGMWNVISPNTPMEKRMYKECDRMIRQYGNHPSFILFSPSNEPKGHWKESLTRWVKYYRQRDPRRLYTTGTGWPLIDNPGPVVGADFLAVHRVGLKPVRDDKAWFGRDYLKSTTGVDVPIITHELGQWCAYPDFDIIDKFTGYMQPGNYEIFRDSMAIAGLLDMNEKFAQASGHIQAACYKEEVEANLRTPGLAGFQLLDLHDYVGQGTALVGVLDAFWQEKGYLSSEEWGRFCNTTVPLAVLKKRVFTTKDAFDIDVQIAHYGKSPILNANAYWTIKDKQGQTVRCGQWSLEKIIQGSAIPLGQINVDLSVLASPQQYKLIVGLSDTEFENYWDFWLYPAEQPSDISSEIFVTRSFQLASDALERGERVLLMPRSDQLQWNSPPIGRKPIFWNRLMGPKWERFLGLYCEPQHPALSEFITENYYQWHWQDVFRPYCRAINMDSLPPELSPIVWMIDDWNRNYKLSAAFECKIGKGRLMVCAADLESDLANRPVAAQLRKSLLSYMKSDAFDPTVKISNEKLMGLHFDNQIMHKLGAVAHATPKDGVSGVTSAIDGNPNTYWITSGSNEGAKYPHELTLSFATDVEMTGLVFMNRQDHREHQGDIKDYEIEISEDGKQWQSIFTGQLESTFNPQQIDFAKKVSTRFLKIRAMSGFGSDTYASFAEIAVVYAGPPLTTEALETAATYRQVASATEEMYEAIDVLQYSSNPTAAKLESVTADSESTTDPADHAFDGNPKTIWHTQWREKSAKQPHWLMVEFKEPLGIAGIRYLPRQDRSNGWIKDYRIETSMDSVCWSLQAKGCFSAGRNEQKVTFAEPANAKYLKLTAESECQSQDFSSVAELVIVEAVDFNGSDSKSVMHGKVAPKPLYRDSIYDGAADPVLCWNHKEQKWFMFYTNRRANVEGLSGVSWVHGTPVGIAESSDGGATWTYRQDANIDYRKGEDTYWAPEVLYHDGIYHMYLSYVPGIFSDWSHPRDIIHLTSNNLLDWEYQSTLKLSSNKVIDACVFRMFDGTWRMWYNNERDRKSIYYADSDDLYNWKDKGKAVGDRSGEGPVVFSWNEHLWMIVDNWKGLGVYRSKDGINWTRQKNNILETPGTGKDDQVKAGHPGVVVSGDRAYLFYFTHPGRTAINANKDTYEQRRSSIQVVELEYKDGWLACDRNQMTYVDLGLPSD